MSVILSPEQKAGAYEEAFHNVLDVLRSSLSLSLEKDRIDCEGFH